MSIILIYGAMGYTGRLCAERAVARGLRPVLAGRNPAALRPLADRLGLAWRAFGLDEPARVREGLAGMAAVLHAAGPFSATASPMAEACLDVGVHYTDITGEIDVLEALAALDARAKTAGVMLLPGAGFDVVPSDCLLAHVVRRLPDATRLRLSVEGLTRASRGTAKTMFESVARGARVRRGGRTVDETSARRATVDFGAGPRRVIAVSWGDVATAWHSTGVPDIEVFFASPGLDFAARVPHPIKRLLGSAAVQRFVKGRIDAHLPAGPSAAQRTEGKSTLLAEAWNAAGHRVASRLRTPEAYHFTALTAVEVAHRAATGSAVPGFQTPSTAFGADFVMLFENVTRHDEAPSARGGA